MSTTIDRLEELRESYAENERVIGNLRCQRTSKARQQEINERSNANHRIDAEIRKLEDQEYRRKLVDFAENAPTEIERRVMLTKLAGINTDEIVDDVVAAIRERLPEADDYTVGEATSNLITSTLQGIDHAIERAQAAAENRAARVNALNDLESIKAPAAFAGSRITFRRQIETGFPPFDTILNAARVEADKVIETERKHAKRVEENKRWDARQLVIEAGIAAGRLPDDMTPDELAYTAERVAEAARYWHADPDPVKPRTVGQLIDGYQDTRRPFAYVLRDHGIYSDGRFAMRLTPGKGWDFPTDESPTWAARLASQIEEFFADRSTAARVVGGRAKTDEHCAGIVFETADGSRRIFDHQFICDVEKAHPGCSWRLTDDDTLPKAIATVDGAPVACVCALEADPRGRGEKKWSDGLPKTFRPRPRMEDLFEQGPYTADDVNTLGKIRGTNGAWPATPAAAPYVHGDGRFYRKGDQGVDDPAARRRREFYDSLKKGATPHFRIEKQESSGYAIIHAPTGCNVSAWTRKREAEQMARLLGRLPIPWSTICEDRPLTDIERLIIQQASHAFEDNEFFEVPETC